MHIGDHACDYTLLQKHIDYIKSNENVFVIGMGDYLNNALKLSKTDVYSAVSPQKELELAVGYLGQIPTSRWLAMVSGNHENRTQREAGLDINLWLAEKLDIADVYHPTMAVLQVRLSDISYFITTHHGAGGGITKGGTANKMSRLHNIIPNADIVVMGHTHQQMAFWDSHYEIDKKHHKIVKHNTLVVNTGSMLSYRNGYAEAMMLQPVRKGNAILTLKDVNSNYKQVGFYARWEL